MKPIIFACVLLVILPCLCAAGADRVSWPIRVEKGAFVDAKGQPFSPRGFNYIRLFPGRGHNTFDPEHFDAGAVAKTMKRWQADGFNVVRVFISSNVHVPGTIAKKGEAGLAVEYVRRVADFLVLARQHGVGVILCFDAFPRMAPYTDSFKPLPTTLSPANAEYLDKAHIEARARFFKDFISGLKSLRIDCLDAIFSYDLQNELCFQGGFPFTLEFGTFDAANGKTYNLPAEREALADDAAVHFIDCLVGAIHEVHRRALVSASVFTYAAVNRSGPGDFTVKKANWQNRIPFRPQAMLRSKADFLDVHFYAANQAGLERDLKSIEFEAVRRRTQELGKPLFVGEFGAFKRTFPEVGPAATWIGTLAREFNNRGFAGWLYWTYDTHEQNAELWHACDQDGAIYRSLKGVK